ncbi:DegT/DnrJ/EryC1/StrS family aminotransferase [Croceivirga thetidis]|uniref:DegT/DnrJ/EryC1/StrS family aminotransferase n=1 Tax=Croceivirga thetidis TaxID=2721623 RepID=A0ABX1GSY9_9FLAO|nr:DegT/DnrJ/EryC1/StrS family aminotransferase [Croceivirga thetidis]NKI32010.1 DegT/DnrJ/EryC1/StrS family aminotransferase [Croceivirga thetidis]
MIPFSPPFINQDIIDEVVDSLESGWITTGPKVKLLEQEISKFVSVPNVLCINSWTSGAIMILKWLGVEEGDEVIIPSYTYSATALAVIHAGAKPVMVDVGTDFNISVKAVEQAITPRTKAIMPVDFAGFPCDYDALNALVRKEEIKGKFNPSSEVQRTLNRILLISDAAHSLGATYKENRIGKTADITIFSLHAVKNVTTAEGGAIVINMPEPFNNEDLYAEMRRMSLNCQTKDALSKSKAGGWRYDIVGLGLKINMPDINAALGLGQMRIYDELLEKRKYVFNRYVDFFSKFEWAIIPPHKDETRESSYHIFSLRIADFGEEQRDAVITDAANNGVALNVHFIPMPLLTFFKGLGYDIDNHPNAYNNFKNEISLPIYPQLTDEQIDTVCNVVKEAHNAALASNV